MLPINTTYYELRLGLVWLGVVWLGSVRHGLAWHGKGATPQQWGVAHFFY
jgi:hypothetical protein